MPDRPLPRPIRRLCAAWHALTAQVIVVTVGPTRNVQILGGRITPDDLAAVGEGLLLAAGAERAGEEARSLLLA